MEIRDGENLLEVVLTDTSPPGSPTAGDLRLAVRVSSEGFAGSSPHVWVDAASFARFVHQLQELEARRHGTARLEALSSPDEFWLELRAVDHAGHMAAFGRVRGLQYTGRPEPYHQAVEFGFEFCPSRLPAVLAGFRAMVPSKA
jgi:hypothetical protein